ncbi:MAG: hypothetical protein Tsb004_15830 [Allomuricauda sp.]
MHLMKKLILSSFILFLGASCFSQKAKFGLEAGYLNGYSKVTDDNSSASSSDGGFFIGGFSEFGLSNKVTLEPHLIVGSINSNGFGFLSVLLGYNVLNKVKIEAGPQLSYLLESTPEEVNSLGVDLGFGLSYDINDHFILSARYNSELSNRASNVESEDLKARFNWLFIGLGYRF